MYSEINPINIFCVCEDCGANIGERCSDCLNHSSRIHFFIVNAPLHKRMQMESWVYSQLPRFVQNNIMMEKASDTTYLNKAEFIIWKKLKLGYNLKFNTLG
jgi:hypothetical protein